MRKVVTCGALGAVLLLAGTTVAQPRDPKGEPRAIKVVPRKADAATWVIAIGVDKYHVVKPLEYAGADALAVAKAFREVGGIDRAHVLLVNDAGEDRPDAATLARLIPEWLKKAGPDDTVVFSFSGHGYRDAAGNLYLAPTDFDPDRKDATGLDTKVLRQHLKECRAATKLIFLDACHSGAFGGANQADSTGLADLFGKLDGAVSIVSSSGRQQSQELHKLKHGIFTYWLVRGLRGEANTTIDGVIDADELYRFLNEKVPETARRELKVEQRPFRSFEQLAGIPVVLELKNPDRPSVLVPEVALPFLPEKPTEDQLANALDAISRFPRANPRRNIGITKWILHKAAPGSDLARKAEDHLQKIDAMIVQGEIPRSALDPSKDREDD